MNKLSLKKEIQRYVNSVRLTNEQLDSLMQMQNTGNETDTVHSLRWRTTFTKIAGIAAALTIIITAGIFYTGQQPGIGERIADEVSKNHLKLKPLEIHSNQLNDLSDYFTQLDFKLVHTKILSDPNWELFGARYCSIQGTTAAQLRLKNRQTGTIETLYQAPYYADQFGDVPMLEKNQLPLEKYAKGMGVRVWVEKDVLFALTKNDLQD